MARRFLPPPPTSCDTRRRRSPRPPTGSTSSASRRLWRSSPRCTRAVATTGAGTSGIVARKIAATLTSTGTPAHFVHPTDALHGGLGVIGRQEVVIAVSNSGETEEISALLPYLRSREVKVIAIVGNLDSTPRDGGGRRARLVRRARGGPARPRADCERRGGARDRATRSRSPSWRRRASRVTHSPRTTPRAGSDGG